MAYGGKQQRGGSSQDSNPTYDYASGKISREQENRDALQQIEAEGREALADIDELEKAAAAFGQTPTKETAK